MTKPEDTPMGPTSLRKRNAVNVSSARIALATLLGTLVVTASAAASYSARYDDVVGPADRAIIDVIIYDGTGSPIFATNESTATLLYDATQQVSLVGAIRPNFERVSAQPQASDRPGDLTRIFADELVGRTAGETFRTRLHEAPFGDWSETIQFDRTIGPFPRTHTVSVKTFENTFPDAKPGDTLALTAFVAGNATLLAKSAVNATYFVEIEEGDTLPVVNIGFTALAVNVSDTAFSLRYSAPKGHEFVIRGACGPPFYSLQPGSYRVASIDEGSITFLRSDAPYPALVGRDVYAEVTIHEIDKLAQLRRFPPPIQLLWSGRS